MKVVRTVCVVMQISMLLVPLLAEAQSSSTGAIAGAVRDTTGAVLPGVTVEATSAALIEKVRTVITDSQGQYKIIDLPLGTYSVTFTLPGFGVVKRDGLQLSANFTAQVNTELTVGSIEETVTVTGASPVVDVQNTLTQNVLTREVLDALPTGKSLAAYATLTLGVTGMNSNAYDVGGNRGETSSAGFGVHGSTSADGHYYQSGMNLSHPTGSGAAASRQWQINQLAVQEIALQTEGTTAENPSGGVVINVVPKEGGNTLSFSALVNGSPAGLQNDNLTDEVRGFGIRDGNPNRPLYDAGLALGGPISRDKLWFYTAHRWWRAGVYNPGVYYNKTPHTLFYTPDLDRQNYFEHQDKDNQGRFTWQATDKHKITGFTAYQCNTQAYGATNGGGEIATLQKYCAQSGNQVVWTYPWSNRLLLDAGATYLYSNRRARRDENVSRDDIIIQELTTGFIWGSGPVMGGGLATPSSPISYTPEGAKMLNLQANERVSLSYVTGSHALKTGFTYLWGHQDHAGETPLHYGLRNGVPAQITQYANPFFSKSSVRQMGLFAQDQWTVRRLTLNLGIRFDYLRGTALPLDSPAGTFKAAFAIPRVDDVPNWKDVTPRLGAAYDLFGNGKTAIKAYIGKFLRSEMTSVANANNLAFQVAQTATRTWNDGNRNFVPDCVLTNPLANGECGQISNLNLGTPVASTQQYSDEVLRGFGVRPFNWHITTNLVRELGPGIALNVGYFRRWFGNFAIGGYSTATGTSATVDNLAVTPADYDSFCVTAPVDPRLPGGGGNQLCGLYDLRPDKFGLVNNVILPTSRYGEQTSIYNGMDIAINMRSSQGQVIQGGVSVGRLVEDQCFTVDSPQAERPGFCHIVPPWGRSAEVKLMGVQPLPWGLQVSATYKNIATPPFQANRVYTNAEIAPSLGRNLGSCRGAATCNATVTIPLVTPVTLYGDRLSQLDLRLTKIIRLGRMRVQAQADVYNAFNVGTIITRNGTYGATWGRPTQIISGRFVKFGAQMDW